MIALEMPDLRFDRTATTPTLAFCACRVLLPLPSNMNLGNAGVAMTPIAFVDIRIRNHHTGDTFHNR